MALAADPTRAAARPGRLRRGLLVDSTPTSPAWRRPARRDVLAAVSGPRAWARAASRAAASGLALAAAADAANDAVIAHTTSGQPGNPASCTFVAAVVDGRSSSWAGSATAGPTGCPTTASARLLTIDDSLAAEQIAHGVTAGRGGERAAGARHHPVARHRRPTTPRERCPSTSPGRVGRGLLRRAVELLLGGPPTGRPLVTSTARTHGASRSAPGGRAGRLGQRPGRSGQHHGGPRPRRRPPAGRHGTAHHHRRTGPRPRHDERKSMAEFTAQPSTRTSSCPTAGPTSTPSSP